MTILKLIRHAEPPRAKPISPMAQVVPPRYPEPEEKKPVIEDRTYVGSEIYDSEWFGLAYCQGVSDGQG